MLEAELGGDMSYVLTFWKLKLFFLICIPNLDFHDKNVLVLLIVFFLVNLIRFKVTCRRVIIISMKIRMWKLRLASKIAASKATTSVFKLLLGSSIQLFLHRIDLTVAFLTFLLRHYHACIPLLITIPAARSFIAVSSIKLCRFL